jgi:predicted MFS family arabinose efflux permease
LGAVLTVMRQYPVIWSAAAYILLMMGANELLLIVYGEWMEQSFALNLTSLGLATGIIGGAEIVGELGVGVAVDRLGKRPVIITSGLFTALFYFLIPYTSPRLLPALVTLFLVFLAFEITIVGGVPLMTEVVPSARSVVLSVVLAAASLGRMLGALVGPAVWQAAGLAGNTLLAAVATLVAVLVLARWVREGELDEN